MSNPAPLDERATEVGAITPYCASLASKKYLLRAKVALEDSDYLDASCHCWCQKTRSALGPDRDVVGPADCRSDRTCWEPIR
ncbi:MAG: hypothetical protein RIT40_276 [Planctomycetota bacterium]|jgi:hypothetical protein